VGDGLDRDTLGVVVDEVQDPSFAHHPG
jgi:hypothetical protein